MNYFKNYVSNTLAGTSNQLFFDNSASMGKECFGMMFYKLTVGGEFEYSLLFSDTIDSTYAKGDCGSPNLKLDDFNVTEIQLGVLSGSKEPLPQNVEGENLLVSVGVKKYTHENNVTYFETLPVKLFAKADDYLAVKIFYTGTRIPCHVERLIPTFKKDGDLWKSDKNIPLANMVGIKRSVKAKVAYLGDSITQGIGVDNNDYCFWNALVSKKLGDVFSYWNLGIGYARCRDVATDGAWLFKAKQADYVVVCLGVNDLRSDNADAKTLCKNLETVVDRLNEAGCKVILQTTPPYTTLVDGRADNWRAVNDYVRNELSKKVLTVFDQTKLLMTEEMIPSKVKYGGHPNKEGCRVWGEALYVYLTENVDIFKQ